MIADEIESAIEPAVFQSMIAGGLRRGEPKVDTIEIVAEPNPDLSGDYFSRIDTAISILEKKKKLSPFDVERGDRKYPVFYANPSGIRVELWLAIPPTQFGVLAILRTGPKHYAESLMTSCRLRRTAGGMVHGSLFDLDSKRCATWPEWGWCIKAGALWNAVPCSECIGAAKGCKSCRGYGTMVDPDQKEPISTPTEESFYKAISSPYLLPSERGVVPLY